MLYNERDRQPRSNAWPPVRLFSSVFWRETTRRLPLSTLAFGRLNFASWAEWTFNRFSCSELSFPMINEFTI